jgi:erythromycin esterase
MQYPGTAMDSVQAFIGRVDPADSTFVSQRYECLGPYRNHGPRVDRAPSDYAALPSETRSACAAGLQDVYDLMAAHSASYEAASSASTYQLRLHDARLVQQYEAMASASATGGGSLSRDSAMAENVEWIRDQAGPDAKIVLWAHNGHVRNFPGTMGGHLRAAYGSDYVNLGFLFGHGSFNAKGSRGEGVRPWTVTDIPSNSIEAIFAGTGKERLLLDTRQLADAGAAAAPLRGPIDMRAVGAVFDSASPSRYFTSHVFPGDFDLLVYVDATTPSTLLSFIF